MVGRFFDSPTDDFETIKNEITLVARLLQYFFCLIQIQINEKNGLLVREIILSFLEYVKLSSLVNIIRFT